MGSSPLKLFGINWKMGIFVFFIMLHILKNFNFEFDQAKTLKSKYLKTQYQPGFPICKGVSLNKQDALEYNN
jgi:hypothetical protein